jgi:hypothetical protein
VGDDPVGTLGARARHGGSRDIGRHLRPIGHEHADRTLAERGRDPVCAVAVAVLRDEQHAARAQLAKQIRDGALGAGAEHDPIGLALEHLHAQAPFFEPT